MKRWQIYSKLLLGWAGCLVLITLSIAGCGRKERFPGPAPVNRVADTTSRPVFTASSLKYLALGDSYTIGQGVVASQRFPQQVAEMLTIRGKKMNAPEYIATTGWTTRDLLTAIASLNPPSDFDIVSLLIGVNNQFRGLDTADYRQQFTQCLEEAIRLARGKRERVFVLSIPDYGATPFSRPLDPGRITRQINEFNEINRHITLAYNISYTDITPGTREAPLKPSILCADSLHYSGLEYGRWAAALVPKMEAVLK